ncbi:CpsD/CapB family tyrosine-protein kinase [Bacillus sp. IB182487]|uniref:non-specific protein-tyrosine kinase n=1 Tax=Metabacillus arenae TaxID=2771434 RepID=A0A926NDJ4_9BACI|nr:CpsD/CapB family tyrosine-protein kinase [Metabacillus arenae]
MSDRKKSLITYINPNSLIAEQYRTIRANIQFSSVEKKFRSIAVTSPGFGEGKSTTVSNLAISMAQQGEKILLIDADVRNPTIHTAFNLNNDVGLTNVLIGTSSVNDAVYQTEIGRLGVLTSGPTPPNPAELIGSEAMRNLIKKALADYDLVLFDCPSVLEAADTKILANECDGVILVVSSGKTDKEKALEANRVLTMARATLLGVILNDKK